MTIKATIMKNATVSEKLTNGKKTMKYQVKDAVGRIIHITEFYKPETECKKVGFFTEGRLVEFSGSAVHEVVLGNCKLLCADGYSKLITD